MLPVINEKGMIQHYGVCHEQFLWDLRSEPSIKQAWATIYGTDELLVSFDCINICFPNRTELPDNKPWPHQDQDPDTRGSLLTPFASSLADSPGDKGFRCLQGFVNLLPSGPEDGGLVVMRGAHRVSDEFHDHFADDKRLWAWTNEMFSFKENHLAWLRSRGFEFEKVSLDAGDLVLCTQAHHLTVKS